MKVMSSMAQPSIGPSDKILQIHLQSAVLLPEDVGELQYLAEQALTPFIIASNYETVSFNVNAEVFQSDSLLLSEADII